MVGDYFQSPGSIFEPGDIFFGIPFPTLKHPLFFYRRSSKNKKQASVFYEEDAVAPTGGDSAHATFTKRTVILLSHGCELEAVERDVASRQTDYERRYWLAAPIRRLYDCDQKMIVSTAEGRQQNKFFLPAQSPFNEPQFVDLRMIAPITVPYFRQAEKKCSLKPDAVASLQAHLCLFFSGLIFSVQPVDCPHCGGPIDPREFVVPSGEGPDID
jgi:hypothetical protein